MSEVRFKLSDHVTVISTPSENSMWIEDAIADLSVMLPLSASFDVSYFEDDQSMVVVCPYEWSCVQLRTTRDRAEHFAKCFGYPLEIHESEPKAKCIDSLVTSGTLTQNRKAPSRRKARARKARRRKH